MSPVITILTILERTVAWLNTAAEVRVQYAEWDTRIPIRTAPRPLLEFYLVTRGEVDLHVKDKALRLRVGQVAVANGHFGNWGDPLDADTRYGCVSLWLPQDGSFADLAHRQVLEVASVRRLLSIQRLFQDVSLHLHLPPVAVPAVQQKTAVLRLVCGLYSDGTVSFTPIAAGGDARVNAALDLLLHRVGEPSLAVTDMARAANLSADQLGRLFKHELGITPIRYLQRLRISRARELLRQTDLSVKEIASMVGFTNQLYFSRVYRQLAGESPSGTRRGAAGP